MGDWRVRIEREDASQAIVILAIKPRGSAYKP